MYKHNYAHTCLIIVVVGEFLF